MYDVLFIDDKFEEIKDTFLAYQKEHIRCFYSDGYINLPENNKEKLPFKNLKYISLDIHLENRDIKTNVLNKNTASMLSSVVNSFVDKHNTDIHIIINTSFNDEFKEFKEDFIKYLKFKPKLTIRLKTKQSSLLHIRSITNDIIDASHKAISRNLVIREAIEIENILVEKISAGFSKIAKNLSADNLKQIEIFSFNAKINLFTIISNDKDLKNDLNTIRNLRNDFAHKPNASLGNLLTFLEQTEKLKQKIKMF